ncbi:Cysteine desulfurase [Stackebrandtia soli]
MAAALLWGQGGAFFDSVSLNRAMTSIYLDAATAAPLHPVAHQALQAAADDGWHDPSRLYGRGRAARRLLDAARETVADVLGVTAPEVSFTANGTAAIATGIAGALSANRRRGDVLVHGAVEHSAVLRAAALHTDAGGRRTSIGVSRTGRVDVDAIEAAVAEGDVALVAVQSANHEVGTRQPIARIAEVVEGAPLFVDAAASLGHDAVGDHWSILAASAHKWGGPSGVGVLAIRKGVRWHSPDGFDGHRAETPGGLDIPAIVAAAAALRAVETERNTETDRQRAMVDRLRHEVPAVVPYVEVVGDPEDRLPHIVTFSYPFESGEPLMLELDREGFAVSAGSACSASRLRPSHVLEEMGVLATGSIRVSLHPGVTEEDVDRFTETLARVVARLRDDAGATDL